VQAARLTRGSRITRFGPPWSLAWERLISHRERPKTEMAGQQGHIFGSMAWTPPSIARYSSYSSKLSWRSSALVWVAFHEPTQLPIDLVIAPALMTVVGVDLDVLGNPGPAAVGQPPRVPPPSAWNALNTVEAGIPASIRRIEKRAGAPPTNTTSLLSAPPRVCAQEG
jgi:hypothetical protein